MVWILGEDGRAHAVRLGCVDCGKNVTVCAGSTEVRLDGWCEGGLG